VLKLEPSNKSAKALQEQVERDKSLRERRLRLLERLQQARSLWTVQNYKQCIEILTELKEEFPREDEVSPVARNCVAKIMRSKASGGHWKNRKYFGGRPARRMHALLLDLQKEFPGTAKLESC